MSIAITAVDPPLPNSNVSTFHIPQDKTRSRRKTTPLAGNYNQEYNYISLEISLTLV